MSKNKLHVKLLPKKKQLQNKESMKNTIFWDITPCSWLSVNRCFGGIYRLHLQGGKSKLSKKPA
jgi:hypothetical protein